MRHALALPGHVAMCLGKREMNISTFVSRFCFFVKRDCIEHRDLAFILGKSALCCSLGEPRFSRDPAVDLKGWMHVLDAAPNASTSPARRPHSPHPRVPPTTQRSTAHRQMCIVVTLYASPRVCVCLRVFCWWASSCVLVCVVACQRKGSDTQTAMLQGIYPAAQYAFKDSMIH